MWSGTTSLPKGQARCLACRRASPKKAQPTRLPGTEGCCGRCSKPFIRQVSNQQLCWDPCRRRGYGANPDRPPAEERGYGADHRAARQAALQAWQDGDPCARCGGPMWHGTPVDLDHTDDRSGYLGLSHSSCNRSTTGRLQSVTHDKVCDHCGVTYTTRYGTQKFCSVACRYAAPKPPKPKPVKSAKAMVLHQCAWCLALHTGKTYCSPTCASERKKAKAKQRVRPTQPVHTFECPCCGVTCASPSPQSRYCSTSCRKRAQKRRLAGKAERSPVIQPRLNARWAA